VMTTGQYWGEEDNQGYDYYHPEYSLELREYTTHTDEPDSDLAPSLDRVPETSAIYPTGIAIEEVADSDYMTISFSSEHAMLWMAGLYDLSGSLALPLVRLYDPAGELVAERTLESGDSRLLFPFLEPDTYLLELTDSEGLGGPEHWFYVFHMVYDEDSALPAEEEPNDSTKQASPLELESGSLNGQALEWTSIQGRLDSEGDEDWFQVEAAKDAQFLTACSTSAWYGSLALPALEVYDAEGLLLGEAELDQDDWPNAELRNLPIQAGSYYLRIHDPEHSGPGAWWRAVFFTSPEIIDDADYYCG